MLSTIYILLIVCLVMIFVEDYRYREVHLSYFLGLLLTSSIIFCVKSSVISDLYSNLLFLIINLVFLKCYMILKGKKMPKELFWGGIALGDVVFLIAVMPLFNFINYALFYVFGMVFSLIFHLGITVIEKNYLEKKETVPLAGYLSLFLIIVLILCRKFGFSLYEGNLFE
ncbi:conserved membrane hypothetical protein [Tenacibaculum maritimum]|nr:conserved membrane hypothetical protein [Tenacibaculum maritimum]CAA0201528.1 conserved membrane hypothetical protein [Tenacibaculum maritimum]CAA0204799.1 conserved membrane hypothetical protein [Tenacibaculum maritimum]